MPKTSSFKTCSRGHTFRGKPPCPICWPGKARKKHIYYHKDGSVWAKGSKVNGMCDGYWEWFRKPARPGGGDGTKMRSGHFSKGKRVGEWITYDKAGKAYKVTTTKQY